MNLLRSTHHWYFIFLLLVVSVLFVREGRAQSSPYSNRFYDVGIFLEGAPLPVAYNTIATDDIKTTGTPLSVSGNRTADIPLGNFTFRFYCQNVTALTVGEDGAILVNQPGGTLAPDNTGYLRSLNAAIVPYWDDWQIQPDSGASVRYEFRGTAPNRRLIVQWTRISPAFSKFFRAQFRAVIYEGTSNIAFYYDDACFIDECDFSSPIRHPDCDNLMALADVNDFAQLGSVGLKSNCVAGSGANVGVNKDPINNRIIDNPGSSVTLKDLATDRPFKAITFTTAPDGCPATPIPPLNYAVCQTATPFQLDSVSPVKFGTWSGSGRPFLTLNTVNLPRSFFRPTTSGTYQLRFDPGCPEFAYDVNIRVDSIPVAKIEGNDTIRQCDNSNFTIKAAAPNIGTGQWVKISGPGVIIAPTALMTTVANVTTGGTTVIRWVVTNQTCQRSDTLVLINDFPTTALVLSPRLLDSCNISTFNIRAAQPAIGTGRWELVGNSGTVTNPTQLQTSVTGLAAGDTAVVYWVVRNDSCVSRDSIKLINYKTVDAVVVSADTLKQCNNTQFAVQAVPPSVGVGKWEAVTPGLSIIGTNPATVTGVPANTIATVRWVVNNGKCTDTAYVRLFNRGTFTPFINTPDTIRNCGGPGRFTLNAQAAPSGTTGIWEAITPNVTVGSGNPTIAQMLIDLTAANTEARVRWVLRDNSNICPDADKSVVLIRDSFVEAMVLPLRVCETNPIILTANNPVFGTGIWQFTPSGGVAYTPLGNTLTINNLPINQAVQVTWRVTNGTCISIRSTEVRNDGVVAANAGDDQAACNNGRFTMAANSVPSGAVGTWSVLNGVANIIDLNDPLTIVNGVPAGTSATLRWTVTNGTCVSSDDIILNNNSPVTASIGANALLENCNTSLFTMSASATPPDATGLWTIQSGTATIDQPTNPLTTVSVPAGQTAVLTWTVRKGVCSDAKNITLINYAQPIANAGADQRMCNMGAFTMAANTPSVGIGTWSLANGTAVINGVNNPAALISIPVGTSAVLRWSVVNGSCSASDEVVLTNDAPVTASVSPVPDNCENGSFVVNANTPSVGTGFWSIVSGSGSLSSTTTPSINVTNVPVGTRLILRWTTTNGTCSSSATVAFSNLRQPTVAFPTNTAQNCTSNRLVDLRALGGVITDADGFWTFIDNTIAHGDFLDINGNITNVWSRAVSYRTSAAEQAIGEVGLRLCSNPVSTCPSVCKDIIVILPTPLLPCINPFNLFFEIKPPSCTVTFNLNDVLGTDVYKYYRVIIISPNGDTLQNVEANTNFTFDASYAGKRFKVIFIDACGNQCEGFINILDKTPPTIICPPNLILDCNDVGAFSSPTLAMSGDLGIDNVLSAALLFFSKGARDGSATDCSPVTNQLFEDFTDNRLCFDPYSAGNVPSVTRLINEFNVSPADAAALVAAMQTVVTQQQIVRIIIRRFRGVDLYGNISLPCYQIIYLKEGDIADINKVVCPPVKTYIYTCGEADRDCGYTVESTLDPNAVPFLDLDMNGIFSAGDVPLYPSNPGFCNLNVRFKDDTTAICGNVSFLIQRKYTIEDFCSGLFKECDPITIKVLDTHQPIVTAEYKNYTPTTTTQCYIDAWGQEKTETLTGQWAERLETKTFDGFIKPCGNGVQNNGTVVEIFASPVSAFCGGRVSIKLTACDPLCTNDSVIITVNDTRLKGRFIQKFKDARGINNYVFIFEGDFDAIGDYPITFSAVDKCGYAQAIQTFLIKVRDLAKPTPSCVESHTASIGTDGTVRIDAATFIRPNVAASDNCGNDRAVARRMDEQKCLSPTEGGCGQKVADNNCFRDYVVFGCCDVGDTISVIVRTIDQSGNFNDCMVRVIVTDKLLPVCIAPPPVTTLCLDYRNNRTTIAQKLADADRWFGTLAFFDNCQALITNYTVSQNLDNCKIGTLTRTWTVKDCRLRDSTRCSQTIQVTNVHDFSVDFPDDVTLTCFAAVPDKNALKTQMLNPLSWERGLDGAVKNDGCGVIAIEIDDQNLTAGDACTKILRRIKVIDWCRYNPNNDKTDMNVNPFGLPLCGDFHSNPNWATENVAAWQSLSRTHLTNGDCKTPLARLYQERRYRDADADLLAFEGFSLGPPNTHNPTHPFSYSDGIITFTQIIKIVDKTPPVGVAKNDTTVCAETCINAPYTTRLSATDNCGAVALTEGLSYNWSVFKLILGKNEATSPLFTGNTPTIDVRLDTGDYVVKWTATDRCGNVSNLSSFKIKIIDCKSPEIISLNKTVSLGGGTALVTLADVVTAVRDNCTDSSFLKAQLILVRDRDNPSKTYPTGLVRTAITVTCADILTPVLVQIWTVDRSGNPAVSYATLTVQDNSGSCPTLQLFQASGTVLLKNRGIRNTTVEALSGNQTPPLSYTTTDASGAFSMNLLAGQTYQIQAQKTDEAYVGVTAFDIALISSYLLGTGNLEIPYGLIAADVDKNGEVDAADMLYIRNFILRRVKTLPAGAWRFIDKSYVFKNPNNPFAEDFPEKIFLNHPQTNQQIDFNAVKVGDVNGSFSFTSSQERTDKTLILRASDQYIKAGSEYSVTLRAEDMDAAALQFTLSFKNKSARISSIESGVLPRLTDDNFGLFDDALTMLWHANTIGSGMQVKPFSGDVFTLRFKAQRSGWLSNFLTIGSELTAAEAADKTGKLQALRLVFDKTEPSERSFRLYQNRPNPFAQDTRIGFELPQAGTATLTFYNSTGQVLKTINQFFEAGYNEVMIQKSDLATSGVIYYRLVSGEHRGIAKMIVLK